MGQQNVCKIKFKIKKTAAFVAFAPDYRVLFLISLNLPEKIYIYSKNVKFGFKLRFHAQDTVHWTLSVVKSGVNFFLWISLTCVRLFLIVDLFDVCEVISNCGSL